MDHFDFLNRGLKTIGYSGKFIPKPDSPCIYLQGNNGPDGCAIFVKVRITDLLSRHTKCRRIEKYNNALEKKAFYPSNIFCKK